MKAVPILRRLLNDEELRVQVWAHYALAILVGDVNSHESAIRQILAKYDAKNIYGLHADPIGGNAADALEKLAEWKLNSSFTSRP